jgi:hypothetical protein
MDPSPHNVFRIPGELRQWSNKEAGGSAFARKERAHQEKKVQVHAKYRINICDSWHFFSDP